MEDNLESTNKDREIEKKSIIQRQPRLMFATFLLVCFFFFFLVDLFSLNGRELTACAVTLGFFA